MTIWDGVDRLIDRATSVSDLRAHRIHLLAARRWRALGRAVPADVAGDERNARFAAVTAAALLAHMRSAYDGPILVFKGPETAARYPEPGLRSFIDVDVLVPDAEAVQRALVKAGFEESEDPPWAFRRAHPGVDLFVERHHLRPLRWPGLPLRIELHRRPSWPGWLTSPFMHSTDELFDVAVGSSSGMDGVLTLPPAHHTLVLATHSWVHTPLGRLRDLVDVAAMSEGVDREELEEIAHRWGIGRLWQTTAATVDAVLFDRGRDTLARRVWARNLENVRERTVFEGHLERWTSSFWALPAGRAARVALSNMVWDLRPAAGESWRTKVSRMGRAIKNAPVGKSKHDEELGPDARQLRR